MLETFTYISYIVSFTDGNNLKLHMCKYMFADGINYVTKFKPRIGDDRSLRCHVLQAHVLQHQLPCRKRSTTSQGAKPYKGCHCFVQRSHQRLTYGFDMGLCLFPLRHLKWHFRNSVDRCQDSYAEDNEFTSIDALLRYSVVFALA